MEYCTKQASLFSSNEALILFLEHLALGICVSGVCLSSPRIAYCICRENSLEELFSGREEDIEVISEYECNFSTKLGS